MFSNEKQEMEYYYDGSNITPYSIECKEKYLRLQQQLRNLIIRFGKQEYSGCDIINSIGGSSDGKEI